MEERDAKVAENFQKWLRKKNQEQNALRAKRAADELELQRQKQLQEQKMQVAIAEWNCVKKKELRGKMRLEIEKKTKERLKKEKDEQEKQQHASLAYQCWLKNTTELDHKRREKEYKTSSATEKHYLKMQERKSEAEISFGVWKKRKDLELQSQMRKNRISSDRAEQDLRVKLEERSYEAEQAYLNWLDALDYL